MFPTFTRIIKGNPDTDLSKYNSFMFCRFLSGNPKSIMLSNMINVYYDMPENCQAILASSFCRANNINFIKFPSCKLEKTDVSLLQSKYKISYEKALEYKELLDRKA